jgi:hypothetical protein
MEQGSEGLRSQDSLKKIRDRATRWVSARSEKVFGYILIYVDMRQDLIGLTKFLKTGIVQISSIRSMLFEAGTGEGRIWESRTSIQRPEQTCV